MANLAALPTELVLLILSDNSEDVGTLFALCLSCRRLSYIIQPMLCDIALSDASNYDWVKTEHPSYQKLMFWAIINQRPEMVNFLLDNGLDVNDWCYASGKWVEERYHETMEGIDLGNACYPLHIAARMADVKMVELLLARGADPEIYCSRGRTALHLVAGAGLKGGWQVDDPFRWKDAPEGHFRLPEPTEDEVLHITKLLCNCGVDPNKKALNSMVPLYYAARSGYQTVVEFLLPRLTDVRDKETEMHDWHDYTPRPDQVRSWYTSDDDNYDGPTERDGSDWDSDHYQYREKMAADDRSYAMDIAARKGYYGIVKLLGEAGATHPEAYRKRHQYIPRSNHEDSVFRYLARRDTGVDYEMIRLLLQFRRAGKRWPTFVQVAERGDATTLEALLNSGHYDENRSYRNWDTLKFKRFSLKRAGHRNDLAVLRVFIANGVEPQYCLSTKAYIDDNREYSTDDVSKWYNDKTVNITRIECVKAVLDAGLDINTTSRTTKYMRQQYERCTMAQQAVIDNDLDLLRLLLSRGADINKRRGHLKDFRFMKALPALSLACCSQILTSYATLEFLIAEAKANASIGDYFGRTPLHHAAFSRYFYQREAGYWENNTWTEEIRYDDRETWKKLLDLLLTASKLDVNAVDHSKRTALHLALLNGSSEQTYQDLPTSDMLEVIVAGLLAAGILVNAKDMLGKTALHYAVMCTRPTLTRFLLDAGADIEARDDEDRTPVYLAAKATNPATLEMLLDAGADPNPVVDPINMPLLEATRAGSEKKRFEWFENRRRHCIVLLIARGATIHSIVSHWVGPAAVWPLGEYTHPTDAAGSVGSAVRLTEFRQYALHPTEFAECRAEYLALLASSPSRGSVSGL